MRPPSPAALAVAGLLVQGCADPAPPDWAAAVLPGAVVSADWAPLAHGLPPVDCPWVYRIEVDYDTPPMGEGPYTAHALVARHPREPFGRTADPFVPRGRTRLAHLYYTGFRVARKGARRDLHVGRTSVGPAAPTTFCTPRTWDPLEDFVTLAFPVLPGALAAPGQRWRGARVEGRCNKTACIDPATYAGGRDNHLRACVTQDVQASFEALLETDGGKVAALVGTWSDGHGDAGISAVRRVLWSVPWGRPLHARVEVRHPFPYPVEGNRFAPVTRTVTITAIDGCPGAGVLDATDAGVAAEVLEAYRAFESGPSSHR